MDHKEQQTEHITAVDAFMAQRQWNRDICVKCGKVYYFKSSDTSNKTCRRGTCGDDRAFLQFTRRKRPVSPVQVYDRLVRHFTNTRFNIIPSMNIASTCGTTDLIIGGVQILDGLIHRKEKAHFDGMFLGQPSVRMQFQDRVTTEDGISTAFVNVCTEKVNGTFSGHLYTLDQWLGALSSLGLNMRDFTIVMRTKERNWGTGSFDALELFCVYGGLELGDAAYMKIPTRLGPFVEISDIGFGLERIVWALNKTPRYYDLLMPGTVMIPQEVCDAYRTITLLALSGVRPGNKGSGLQFRRLAKAVSERGCDIDLYAVVGYYLRYWSDFVQEVKTHETVYQVIGLEMDRFLNLMICATGNLPPPQNETTEAYFHRLVYTLGMDAQKLRQLIQTCRR